MNVISSDELIYPLFSDEVDTFILPILNNKNLLRQPIKLADGWRYFEDIVVLQKKKFLYVRRGSNPGLLLPSMLEGRNANHYTTYAVRTNFGFNHQI